MNTIYAPLELKFADNAPQGMFSGYASVFNNEDSHGDVVKPGAFAESLAEMKTAGRSPPMYVMHRILGGDGLPVGVWPVLEEDKTGLRVEGKISGMNTDAGRLLFERVKDGALGGLSVGYNVRPGGSVIGKRGEPKRTLTKLGLVEVSLVADPSNPLTRVEQVKSALVEEIKELMKTADIGRASKALAGAMSLHSETLSGQNSPTVEQRATLLNHLQDAHEAITGSRVPSGMKAMPTTIRDFEALLRVSCGFSNAEARSIAESGFKASLPRDEVDDQAKVSTAFMQALLDA